MINNRVAALALVRKGMGALLLFHAPAQDDLVIGRLQRLHAKLHFGCLALKVAFRDHLPVPAALVFADGLNGQLAD